MIWFTVLLLISARADEACEKKIGKIAELACSGEPLDIGTAEIKLSEEAKELEEKQRKANIEEMLRAFKKKIRSLKRPVNKNANFLLFLSLAEQEIKEGVSPSNSVLSLKDKLKTPSVSVPVNFDGDEAALEACIRTKKEDKNIRVPDSCANLLAQVLTERAHRELFYDRENKGKGYNSRFIHQFSLEAEFSLRRNYLYQEVVMSQRIRIISENNEIYKKLNEAVEATLVDVKKTMKDFISKPSIIQSKEVREKMQEKIERIKFKGSRCLHKDSNSVAPLFMKNAGYNPKTEIFKFCRGVVDDGRISEYQLVHIISHELAHSIDPCNIQLDFKSNSAPMINFKESDNPIINFKESDNPEKIYPFPIIECLRSKGSVRAFRPKYPLYPFRPFCKDKDQMKESFCDWLAAEILFRHMNSNSKLSKNNENQHINGIASIFRLSCNPIDGLGPSKLGQDIGRHPAPIDRLERILLAHPGIRRKLCGENAKSDVKYCDPTIKPTNRSGDKSSSSIK